MVKELRHVNWKEELNRPTVEKMWARFRELVEGSVSKNVPLKENRRKKN